MMRDFEKDKIKLKKSERKIEILEEMLENQTRDLYVSNQVLEKQNEELRHFAYIVSHDMKAPLRAIHGLSHFIKEDINNNNIPEALDNLTTLQRRILRMDNLINGILSYSKITMVESESTSINLDTLISEVIDNQRRPENFEIKIMSPLPVIYGVQEHFIQLFSNLISNGVKYNDKSQGSIVIDYKNLGKHHEFSIEDNGPGIPKNYHEKIFVVFQTLHSRDSIESTGIGLSIVKKIIDKLNGSIRLESDENKSTKFIILLPKN